MAINQRIIPEKVNEIGGKSHKERRYGISRTKKKPIEGQNGEYEWGFVEADGKVLHTPVLHGIAPTRYGKAIWSGYISQNDHTS